MIIWRPIGVSYVRTCQAFSLLSVRGRVRFEGSPKKKKITSPFYQFCFLMHVLKMFLAKPGEKTKLLDLAIFHFVIIQNKFNILSIRIMFFERNINCP